MINKIKQPKYTGENRCIACTIVNVVIAFIFASIVAIFMFILASPYFAASVVVGVLTISFLAIWLRGYLIPNTPELTKQYLPASVLALFKGSRMTSSDRLNSKTINGEEIESILMNAEILEKCKYNDDLCLSESFTRSWNEKVNNINNKIDPDEAVSILGFDPTDTELEHHGNAIIAHSNGGDSAVGKWPSEAALRADIVSESILSKRIDNWNTYSPLVRGQVLHSLRLFFDKCPNGEKAELKEEIVESCCSSQKVATIICEESGNRLFEQPIHE